MTLLDETVIIERRNASFENMKGEMEMKTKRGDDSFG